MDDRCIECGATLDPGASCRAHLESLLAREWQIPGGPGALSHFFAIATYGMQHPRAMNYTRASLIGLRDAVADALLGHAAIEILRRRAGAGAREQGRVSRRAEDAEVAWHVGAWPMTIVNVLPAMKEQDSYARAVVQWARSVIETLRDTMPSSDEG